MRSGSIEATPDRAHRRLLQIAFDAYVESGEWPMVDHLQHKLDVNGEDIDVIAVGRTLDPRLGRVDPGYQGRVTLRLRGIRTCAGGDAELQMALAVMRFAHQRWLRDGVGATLSTTDVVAELGLDPSSVRRVHEYLRWLPGYAGGSSQADGTWTVNVGRDIRRFRDIGSVDGLIDLEPPPWPPSAPVPPALSGVQLPVPDREPGRPLEGRPSVTSSRPAKQRVYGDRWRILESLGEGGQAHTFRVADLRDGSTGWVLKRLKNHARVERFKREVRALTLLDSRHVPAIVDHSLEEPAYLVTRDAGHDLNRAALGGRADDRLRAFRQVVLAVVDAHRAGIVHRDIKPNNVVVDEGGLVSLVDFGICAETDAGTVLTTTLEGFGNRAFSAPECEPGSMDAATEASDVYSLGKLLFWMVTDGRLVTRERFDVALVPDERVVREAIVPLLTYTIREDPSGRWRAEQLLARLDWAIQRLDEHRRLADEGLTIVADSFGPEHEHDRSSSRSATTHPRGNPPGRNEVAEAFETGAGTARLVAIELRLAHRSGIGEAVVSLEEDDAGRPSAAVLHAWRFPVASPAPEGALNRLEPDGAVVLDGSARYWIHLRVEGTGVEVAWMSGAPNLVPRRALFAERVDDASWRPAESRGGPGHAMRVLSRPVQDD